MRGVGILRELRELVDQALQRFDLADDRARALLDQRPRAGRRIGEVTLEPLGRELDRRQRVLDLVREPARDLAPCGDLLRADERRHVVQHENLPFVRAAVADQRRRHDRQMRLVPLARDRDLRSTGWRLRVAPLREERRDGSRSDRSNTIAWPAARPRCAARRAPAPPRC